MEHLRERTIFLPDASDYLSMNKNRVIKNVFAAIIGLVAGFAVIYAVEMLSHFIYPFPESLDTRDMEAMAEYSKTLPAGAFWFVILAYLIGSFVAGFLSKTITSRRGLLIPLIVATFLFLGGLINLLLFSHPVWFWIVSQLVFFPATLLGSYLVNK